MRVTGQLYFDSSDFPWSDSQGAVKATPDALLFGRFILSISSRFAPRIVAERPHASSGSMGQPAEMTNG